MVCELWFWHLFILSQWRRAPAGCAFAPVRYSRTPPKRVQERTEPSDHTFLEGTQSSLLKSNNLFLQVGKCPRLWTSITQKPPLQVTPTNINTVSGCAFDFRA